MKELVKYLKDQLEKILNSGWSSLVVIFLLVVLIYILVYVISSIFCGRSVVVTKLVRVRNSIQDTIKSQVPKSKKITNDDPSVEEDAMSVAKKAYDSAVKAQTTAREAIDIAENALAIAEKGKNLIPIFYKRDKKPKKNQEFELPIIADQYYYLPTASLVIKATATVVVTKSPDNIITSAELSQLQLENKVVLEPDTAQLYSLRYNSFSFANDELRLNTNASGLLESLSSTTEDRISNIIAEISEAPKKILTPQLAIPSAEAINEAPIKNVTTETITYINTFIILSEEFQESFFRRIWVINVDGTAELKTTVDASFECRFVINKREAPDLYSEWQGILTRTLSKVKLDMYLAADRENNAKYGTKDTSFKNELSLFYEITVPDPSILIQIPIKRAHFVKKVHTPKFSNGILIENYINKPSEVEGALSIPINILKAIVSIPAQLLSFKIAHIQQETSLETAKQNLDKARVEAEKLILESKKNILDAGKDFFTTQKTLDTTKSDIQGLLQKVAETKQQPLAQQNKEDKLSFLVEQLRIKKELMVQILSLTSKDAVTDTDLKNVDDLQKEIDTIETQIKELDKEISQAGSSNI